MFSYNKAQLASTALQPACNRQQQLLSGRMSAAARKASGAAGQLVGRDSVNLSRSLHKNRQIFANWILSGLGQLHAQETAHARSHGIRESQRRRMKSYVHAIEAAGPAFVSFLHVSAMYRKTASRSRIAAFQATRTLGLLVRSIEEKHSSIFCGSFAL
jgi:hypothetical protein